MSLFSVRKPSWGCTWEVKSLTTQSKVAAAPAAAAAQEAGWPASGGELQLVTLGQQLDPLGPSSSV